jgi:GcrA cell cycle regulator
MPTLVGGQRQPWASIDGLLSHAAALWLNGLSAAKIAVELNSRYSSILLTEITKNAVVGAAHRYEWPARPTPILRRVELDQKAAKPVLPQPLPPMARTLPPLVSLSERRARSAPLSPTPPAPDTPLNLDDPAAMTAFLAAGTDCRAAAPPRQTATVVAFKRPSSRTCLYPFGDPRTRNEYRTCGDPVGACTGPYCKTHADICYDRSKIQ